MCLCLCLCMRTGTQFICHTWLVCYSLSSTSLEEKKSRILLSDSFSFPLSSSADYLLNTWIKTKLFCIEHSFVVKGPPSVVLGSCNSKEYFVISIVKSGCILEPVCWHTLGFYRDITKSIGSCSGAYHFYSTISWVESAIDFLIYEHFTFLNF